MKRLFLFTISSLTMLMAISPAAMAAWQIIEDDFLYLRQDTAGGSVILYCSKPGHRLFPVMLVWPKAVSTGGNGIEGGVVKLILPDTVNAKALMANIHGKTASVKLERDTDDLLERLRSAAENGGSVFVVTQAGDGGEMSMEIDLAGYLDTQARFEELCMGQSEDLLERLDRRTPQ